VSERKKSSRVSAAAVAKRVGQSSTLADLVVERAVHPATGLSAFYWISAWGLVLESTGLEPRTPAEVAAALGMPRSTAFSWQKAFRKVFPEYQTPAVLWASVSDQVTAEDPSVAAYQVGAADV